ncbi:hypothetical protein I5W36_16565 [Stenotrophomonas maltophilia]|nr:hypothetical protein [Stenotrophomonas maltophilia]
MSQLQQLWNGISPCMEPGIGGCVVWWDAWAAVGTVLAVFTAIFGPSIQRRFFLRKKANAVFAAAYRSDTLMARIILDGLIESFPVSAETDPDSAAPVVHPLADSAEEREYFEQYTEKLSSLANREVDGSKWPAADLDLILAVAHAVQSAKDVVRLGKQVNGEDAGRRGWDIMEDMFRSVMSSAKEDIGFADRSLARATDYPSVRHKALREPWDRVCTWWRKLLRQRAGQ